MEYDNNNRPVGAPSPASGPIYESPAPVKKRGGPLWKIGLVLLIAGAVVTAAGMGMGGMGSITFKNGRVHVNKASDGPAASYSQADTEPFDKVDVKSSSAEVNIIESDHYGIEMNLPEGLEVDWSVSNGTLKIEPDNEGLSFSIMNFNFDFDFDEHYINVYYPEGAGFESVEAETSSGGINAELARVNEVKLKASSGGVNAEVGEVGFIEADVNSGGITLTAMDRFWQGGSFDRNWFTKADLKASSGGINIEGGGYWRDLEMESNSGGVYVDADLIAGETNVDVSSGGVEINTGVAEDYGYNLRASSGGITVNGDRFQDEVEVNEDSETMFNIKSSSGGITLNVD